MEHIIREINEERFDSIISSDRVVVDFFTTWCGPCKTVATILDDIAKLHHNTNIVKLNIDKAQETAAKLHISSIPTLIVFKKGKEIKRIVGIHNREMLEDFVLNT